MVLMINRVTGGDMWVHEDRVNSYIAAGHRLAAPTSSVAPAKDAEEKKPTKKK